MSYSAAEIESIVRRVLTQLTDSAAPNFVNSGVVKGTHPLSGKVISIESLRSIPSDATAIQVGRRALVTPAALDWLKERRIQLVRSIPSTSSSLLPPPIAVVGTATWLPKLGRQVCSKQAIVASPAKDDSAALLEAKAEIRSGRKMVLMVADFSYASCWQAGRDESLRPVVLQDWKQLQTLLSEVPANLLIVQQKDWAPYSVANAIRKVFESFTQHGSRSLFDSKEKIKSGVAPLGAKR